MNCTECKEKLIELLEDVLPESQRQTVEEHLKDCQICQAELQKLKELSKRLISDSKTWQQTSLEDAVCNRIIREQSQRLKQSNRIKRQFRIWRKIMNSKITKFAAAAVIIIAIMIGINQFGGSMDGASVAWAEVAKNVEQTQAFIFRTRSTQTRSKENETTEMNTMTYISPKYGTRIDGYKNGQIEITTYGSLAEKAIISLIHPIKKYERIPMPEEEITAAPEGPKEFIKRFFEVEYKKLGRKIIDGREVEGIEVHDPKLMSANFTIESLTGRLWVDVATSFPVLLETEFVGNNDGSIHISSVYDNFQWNVELEASFFEPDIPEDYDLFKSTD